MIDTLEQYLKLIQKEAWRAYHKLTYNCVSVYSVDDLINEGVIQFLTLAQKYKKEKSKVTTILTIVLRNHYTNLLKYETRRVALALDDVVGIVSYRMNYDMVILFREVDRQLSVPAQEVFRCLLGVDTGYERWLGRRDWARKNFGCRYRVTSARRLLEGYLRRPLEFEFNEISKIVGWDTIGVKV